MTVNYHGRDIGQQKNVAYLPSIRTVAAGSIYRHGGNERGK